MTLLDPNPAWLTAARALGGAIVTPVFKSEEGHYRCRCGHLSSAHRADGCYAGIHNEMRCGCLGYAPPEPAAS